MLRSGATVVIISDGWDRGDPELLAAEMARLQRSCRRLIWLNPLLGAPGYQPLTQGIRAALPYVDEFLPIHNLQEPGGAGRSARRGRGSAAGAPRQCAIVGRQPSTELPRDGADRHPLQRVDASDVRAPKRATSD